MIARFIRFRSPLQDEGEFDTKGNVIAPGGRRHAELLFPLLQSAILKNAKEPWNEEDYAWQFIGTVNRVGVSFIVGEYSQAKEESPRIQVLVSALSLTAWLFRKRKEKAVYAAAEAVVHLLRADGRMSDIQNLSEEEERNEISRDRLKAKRA